MLKQARPPQTGTGTATEVHADADQERPPTLPLVSQMLCSRPRSQTPSVPLSTGLLQCLLPSAEHLSTALGAVSAGESRPRASSLAKHKLKLWY